MQFGANVEIKNPFLIDYKSYAVQKYFNRSE